MKLATLLLGGAIGGAVGYVLATRATTCARWQLLRRISTNTVETRVGAAAVLLVSRGGAPEMIAVQVTRALEGGERVGRVVSGPTWGPPVGYAVQFSPSDVATTATIDKA